MKTSRQYNPPYQRTAAGIGELTRRILWHGQDTEQVQTDSPNRGSAVKKLADRILGIHADFENQCSDNKNKINTGLSVARQKCVLSLYASKFKEFKWHQISLITKNTEAY